LHTPTTRCLSSWMRCCTGPSSRNGRLVLYKSDPERRWRWQMLHWHRSGMYYIIKLDLYR